jgi:anti-sigma factor RsiW
MTSPCRAVRRSVESYLDGELEPSQVVEVEKHTLGCATCRERVILDRAIRFGVRRAARASTTAPSLRDRVAASMAAARQQNERATGSGGLSKKVSLMIAAAAAGLAIAGVEEVRKQPEEAVSRPSDVARASVGLDAMLDQFVDWHARPLPPETTKASDLTGFEPYVGVPVRAPALSPFGARLLGGRILPVNDERVAAMLQYTLAGGHRISIYVYDPHYVRTSPSRLRQTVIGSEPVYIGHVRGWSVAAAEQRGVGYAVASDLNDEESAELALAAAPPVVAPQ